MSVSFRQPCEHCAEHEKAFFYGFIRSAKTPLRNRFFILSHFAAIFARFTWLSQSSFPYIFRPLFSFNTTRKTSWRKENLIGWRMFDDRGRTRGGRRADNFSPSRCLAVRLSERLWCSLSIFVQGTKQNGNKFPTCEKCKKSIKVPMLHLFTRLTPNAVLPISTH